LLSHTISRRAKLLLDIVQILGKKQKHRLCQVCAVFKLKEPQNVVNSLGLRLILDLFKLNVEVLLNEIVQLVQNEAPLA